MSVRIIHVVILVYFFFFVFFFFPPGLHRRHMKVPRLGVRLELQLPAYTTATVTPDPSCFYDLHHSSRQQWILNHWERPGIEPEPSRVLVRFVTAEPWWELLLFYYWKVFHGMNKPQLIYPCFCLWMFEFIPIQAIINKVAVNILACLLVDACTHISWKNILLSQK